MRPRHYFFICGITVLLLAAGWMTIPAMAAPQPKAVNPQPAPRPVTADDQACLACHQNPDFQVVLPNGDNFNLAVSPDEFSHSVHGESGIACVQCHTGFEPGMGHGLKFGSRREVVLQLNAACGQCHATQAEQVKDSVHSAARSTGMLQAAICTDCHTAHAVQRVTDSATGQLLATTRAWVPTTCQQCHSAIYDKYRNSVHGAALTDANNVDVPTCIDCHGVHVIEDPTTATFRLKSPQICAKCHTDPNRMDKYGISTQVLDTYVADFHGTTVSIFEQVSPDAATNKPVCYDCHGIHDIAKVNDPQKGLQIKQNLLAKCQKCHPDASSNFPDAWMSHYIPSPDKYPLVYYINLFYKFLIPGVLVPMGILVVMDFSRMLINRFRKKRPKKHPVEKERTPKKPLQPQESQAEVSAEADKPAEAPVETESIEVPAPVAATAPTETEAGTGEAPASPETESDNEAETIQPETTPVDPVEKSENPGADDAEEAKND